MYRPPVGCRISNAPLSRTYLRTLRPVLSLMHAHTHRRACPPLYIHACLRAVPVGPLAAVGAASPLLTTPPSCASGASAPQRPICAATVLNAGTHCRTSRRRFSCSTLATTRSIPSGSTATRAAAGSQAAPARPPGPTLHGPPASRTFRAAPRISLRRSQASTRSWWPRSSLQRRTDHRTACVSFWGPLGIRLAVFEHYTARACLDRACCPLLSTLRTERMQANVTLIRSFPRLQVFLDSCVNHCQGYA